MKLLSEPIINKYYVKNPKLDEIQNTLQRHVNISKKTLNILRLYANG